MVLVQGSDITHNYADCGPKIWTQLQTKNKRDVWLLNDLPDCFTVGDIHTNVIKVYDSLLSP